MLTKTARKVLSQRISAHRVVLTSFTVDFLDIALNLVIALLTGSVVMMAATLQGLADLAAAGFLVVGLKRSKQPADQIHQFGYGREIYFWTLLSGFVIVAIAAGLSIYLGWQRFLSLQPIDNLFLAYAALLLGTVTNGYAFSLSFRRLLGAHAKHLILHAFFASPLIETKTTFILDLKGTATAVVGLLSLVSFGLTGNQHMDGIGAILIGIVVSVLAFFQLAGVRALLVGQGAFPRVEAQIRQAALSHPQVTEVLGIKTMHTGTDQLLVHLDAHFAHNLTTQDIERVIDEIKQNIRAIVPSAKHIQVELETPKAELSRIRR